MKDHPEIPAKLRVEMWLGLEKQQQYWTGRPKTEGDFCVFAETVRRYCVIFLTTVMLSDAPHKNYRKLHCSVALALSHTEYL